MPFSQFLFPLINVWKLEYHSPEILIKFYLFPDGSCHAKKKCFVIGTMEGRMGLLFLLVLGGAWACDGRELANCDQLSSNTANSGSSDNIVH